MPTESTQLARPVELPMRKIDLPLPEGEDDAVAAMIGRAGGTDRIATGSVAR